MQLSSVLDKKGGGLGISAPQNEEQEKVPGKVMLPVWTEGTISRWVSEFFMRWKKSCSSERLLSKEQMYL